MSGYTEKQPWTSTRSRSAVVREPARGGLLAWLPPPGVHEAEDGADGRPGGAPLPHRPTAQGLGGQREPDPGPLPEDGEPGGGGPEGRAPPLRHHLRLAPALAALLADPSAPHTRPSAAEIRRRLQQEGLGPRGGGAALPSVSSIRRLLRSLESGGARVPHSPPPGAAGGGGVPRAPRQSRTAFSPRQRRALEDAFQRDPYPEAPARAKLAQEAGLPLSAVTAWFSNRRARRRREAEAAPDPQAPPGGGPCCSCASSAAALSYERRVPCCPLPPPPPTQLPALTSGGAPQ
nr:homeobox protein prophet of Pit-1-like [Anolis sagrei ordinatus]